jgi:FtsP/CotA-like multicopper oxidase with cupredoxin domain
VDTDLHTAAFSAVRAAAARAGALVLLPVAVPTGPVPDLLLARAAHPVRTPHAGHEAFSDTQAQRIQTSAHRTAHGKAANGAVAASGAKSSPLSTLTAGRGRPAD